jgi:CDP-diacylglycerol--glycerol-3-phosphate 3-phosphatidyltransferase
MLSRWVRIWDSRVFKPVISFLAWLKLTPNELTLASLALAIAAGVLFALQQKGWAVTALVLAGLLDVFDGELACFTGSQTPFGAFLDSICDHLGDLALYLGFLWRFVALDSRAGILLVMLAMFGSVFGSQVRSRAGMVGLDLKDVGWATRLERILVMSLGAVFNQLVLAFWVLALLTNLNALQRIIYAARASRKSIVEPTETKEKITIAPPDAADK